MQKKTHKSTDDGSQTKSRTKSRTKSQTQTESEDGIELDSPVNPYEGMSEQEIQKFDLENRFNLIIVNVFEHLSSYYADDDIRTARQHINDVLAERPDGPICCFLKYVYLNDVYRKHLLNMNEEFFLDSGEIENDPELLKDKMIMEKLFSFKKTWKNFNSKTRFFIMKSLRGLVMISTKYIEVL